MRINAFRRPNVERRERAQSFARQPRMDGTCRQNHWHGNTVARHIFVSQNKMPCARPHCVFGFCTYAGQTVGQIAATFFKGTVNLNQISVEVLLQLFPLSVSDKRAIQYQNLGLATVLVQHIL